MIKRIKALIKDNKKVNKQILLQTKEIEWAHIFHDSIKGKPWLENTALNVGRWAGNYAFFYVLHRVLKDCAPKNILEFGLGESSKLVTAYMANELIEANHLIIEQDKDWLDFFISRNKLSIKTEVQICALEKKIIHDFEVSCYHNLEELVKNKFDLYIIDGPFGSKRFSRYDIVYLANRFSKTDEFIIIMDDYQRKGEQDTVDELQAIFKEKDIEIHLRTYKGNKTVCVLVTKQYRFLASL